MPRAGGEHRFQPGKLVHGKGQQDLPRQHAARKVILRQERRERIGLGLVGGGSENARLAAGDAAILHVDNGAAGLGGARVEAPDVGVGADAGDDLLALAEHLDGGDAVAQDSGLLEVQLLRLVLHLGLQLACERLIVTREERARLLDALLIFLRVRLAAAEAVAAAHVMVEAGALLPDIAREPARAGRQAEGGADRVDGGAGLAARAEGPEVARAVVRRFVGKREARIGPAGETDKGVALIVLEQNIVVRLMLLDEGVFEDQRLELAGDKDGVEMVDLRDHAAGLFIVARAELEILADTVFELFRLADVDDLARCVHHQINARGERQVVGLFEQLLLGHALPPFRGKRRLRPVRNRLSLKL